MTTDLSIPNGNTINYSFITSYNSFDLIKAFPVQIGFQINDEPFFASASCWWPKHNCNWPRRCQLKCRKHREKKRMKRSPWTPNKITYFPNNSPQIIYGDIWTPLSWSGLRHAIHASCKPPSPKMWTNGCVSYSDLDLDNWINELSGSMWWASLAGQRKYMSIKWKSISSFCKWCSNICQYSNNSHFFYVSREQ